jgi:hypothetical protein
MEPRLSVRAVMAQPGSTSVLSVAL